jgi:hypothetical protein
MLEKFEMTERPWLHLAVCALIVGAAATLSVRAAVPTVGSPFALLSTLFALLVFDLRIFDGDRFRGLAHILAALPVVILFLVWSIHLMRRKPRIPRRSEVLYATVILLSVIYFASAWGGGAQRQGLFHTSILLLMNVGFAALTSFILFKNRLAPKYSSSLAFHAILFSWLGWCAFPWLGELL